MSKKKKNEAMYIYEKEVERLPSPAQNTAPGVLYAIVVATGLQCKQNNKALITNALLKPASPSEYSGDKRLEQRGPNKTFRGLVESVTGPPAQPKPVIKVDKSDTFTVPYIQAVVAGTKSSQEIPESEVAIRVSLEGLNQFHKYALLQTAIQRILQINASNSSSNGELLDKLPVVPALSATDRSLLETELLTFTDLSAADTFKYNQLQKLDDLVTKHVSPPTNFSTTFYASQGGSKASNLSLLDENSILKRGLIRLVSSVLLPQLISQQLVKEPLILGRYYEMTDQLLYALVWRPVDRRVKISTWSPEAGYSDVEESERSVEKLGDMSAGSHAAVVMTPAGQSLVHARYSYSSHEGWLSIYVDGAIVGYRAIRHVAAASTATEGEEEPAAVAETVPTEEAAVLLVEGEADAAEAPPAEAAAEAAEAPIAEADEAPIAEGEGASPSKPEPISKKKTNPARISAPAPTPAFFCQTEEGCRVMVTHSAAPQPCAKPDRQGTVCLTACPPSGLQVSVSSNGTVCMNVQSFPAYRSRERRAVEGAEVRRFVMAEGVVVRRLSGGAYSRDVLYPSGARVLYRNKAYSKELSGFHKRLFKAGPAEWTHAQLGSDGSVRYYTSESSSAGTLATELSSSEMRSTSIDAETRAQVSSFLDGRFLITHTDGLTELLLMDNTRLVTHPTGSFVIVSKPLLPTVEVDVETDKTCEAHSRGQQISLSKSGLFVRRRIAMPDGASCFVKYDTRVTSRVNGSIRYVKRDRATIVATDDGKAAYSPRSAWSSRAEAEFSRDCADPSPSIEVKKSASQISFAADASQSLAEGSAVQMVAAHASASTLLEPSHMSSVTNASVGSAAAAAAKISKADEKKSVPKTDGRKQQPGYNSSSILDIPSSPESTGTKFVVDLANRFCRIEDHEYNRFHIDLTDPLKSTVDLAGEVEGLKPTAVADVPVDPKLFIIDRGLDAIEYVSNGDFKNIESVCSGCPDMSKFTSSAVGQPSDLSSAGTQHTYFARMVSGLSEDDSYTLAESFAERLWQSRPVPPTASLQQVRLREAVSRGKAERPLAVAGKVFEVLTLLESMPLSSQGYAQLTHGFERYNDFLAYRQRSKGSFAVDDDRGFAEREAETLLSVRIQKAYQKARKDAKKNKKSQPHMETSLMLEAIDSADEFDDDQLPPAEGPLEAELLESFDSYAASSPDPFDPSVRTATIAFDDVRTALIQVLNVNVTNSTIVGTLRRTNKEYVNMYYEDASIKAFPPLSYAEFKSLYYHIASDIASTTRPDFPVRQLAATISSDSNSYISDNSLNLRMNKTAPHKLQLNDLMSSTDSALSGSNAVGSGINAVRKYK